MAVPLVPGPGLGDANAAQKSMSTLLKNQCDFCAVLIEPKHFQFGLDDFPYEDRERLVAEWRERWVAGGCVWKYATGCRRPPEGWDPQAQLARTWGVTVPPFGSIFEGRRGDQPTPGEGTL